MQPDEMKALRARLGLTQQGFADVLGMSRKAVNGMENGTAKIELRTALSLDVIDQLASARDHEAERIASLEAGGALMNSAGHDVLPALLADARQRLERLNAALGPAGADAA